MIHYQLKCFMVEYKSIYFKYLDNITNMHDVLSLT